MAARERANPAAHTKSDLANRGAETVAVVGKVAQTVVKSSSSPALKSTLTAFADYERTIDSTGEMLRKINQGLADLDEALDEAVVQTATCAARPAAALRPRSAHQLALTIRSCPPYLRCLDPHPPDLKPDHPTKVGNPSQPRLPQRLFCTSSNAHPSLPNGVRNDYGAHSTRGVITAGHGHRVPRLVLMRSEMPLAPDAPLPRR